MSVFIYTACTVCLHGVKGLHKAGRGVGGEGAAARSCRGAAVRQQNMLGMTFGCLSTGKAVKYAEAATAVHTWESITTEDVK